MRKTKTLEFVTFSKGTFVRDDKGEWYHPTEDKDGKTTLTLLSKIWYLVRYQPKLKKVDYPKLPSKGALERAYQKMKRTKEQWPG